MGSVVQRTSSSNSWNLMFCGSSFLGPVEMCLGAILDLANFTYKYVQLEKNCSAIKDPLCFYVNLSGCQCESFFKTMWCC